MEAFQESLWQQQNLQVRSSSHGLPAIRTNRNLIMSGFFRSSQQEQHNQQQKQLNQLRLGTLASIGGQPLSHMGLGGEPRACLNRIPVAFLSLLLRLATSARSA
jgi:hypothetical protein